MSREDHIYMAGLMDGEGTIGISRNNKTDPFRTPYASMSSTTRELVDWLKDTYGGYISVQKVYQDHHKESWTWKLVNKGLLLPMLEDVLPFMKEPEKIRRGRLLTDRYDLVTVRNGKYTPAQIGAKIKFEEEFLGKY
jgi:hypothetical protein